MNQCCTGFLHGPNGIRKVCCAVLCCAIFLTTSSLTVQVFSQLYLLFRCTRQRGLGLRGGPPPSLPPTSHLCTTGQSPGTLGINLGCFWTQSRLLRMANALPRVHQLRNKMVRTGSRCVSRSCTHGLLGMHILLLNCGLALGSALADPEL